MKTEAEIEAMELQAKKPPETTAASAGRALTTLGQLPVWQQPILAMAAPLGVAWVLFLPQLLAPFS